ncbi:hypothetical protein NQ317_013109 [Molorchus minor]|uniref:Transient receptor ion channel domain-containing protein n=1 Tax=Molorchus minor TaxID=1323400 RepID=A0ABQ9JYC9_9CUCU|nr:hypothetical protein NQ317_013109 [Molorchus minor]
MILSLLLTCPLLTIIDSHVFITAHRIDLQSVNIISRMLQRAEETSYININCVDPLGRSALLMAIDNENLEMVELLIEHRVETKDALLHAISEEFVEAVEVLLEHEETIHKLGEPHGETELGSFTPDTATFTPDITPLILSAHRDNYEIIKILLDRGATLPMPHDVRCGCDECVTSRMEDSLRHSRSRINAYRALASPSLIALSSKDPILTAFELSWELRRLSFMEHEFKSEYQELRKQCQDFATALLDHTRSSYELEVLLNHDPTGPAFEHGDRMHLNRLKLAIKLRQKKFVAHSNVQQLLASIWYEGLPGFRRKNMVLQALEIVRIGILFPFFSIAYILAPHSVIGQTMRKPFIKFICHSASYFLFFVTRIAFEGSHIVLLVYIKFQIMLILASQRQYLQSFFGVEEEPLMKRGAKPSLVEWIILSYVSGLIWSEIKQLWDVGLEEYVRDMWNVIDFITNSLYVATVALRIVSIYQKFSAASTSNWIVRYTYPSAKKYVYRKVFKCQHNSFDKVRIRKRCDSRSRDKGCNATVNILMKKINPDTIKNDCYLKNNLNIVITVDFVHNHNVMVAEIFSYLRMASDTQNIFLKYFDNGMTPSTAKTYHEMFLEAEYEGNDLFVQQNPEAAKIRREKWDAWDPMLISEGLFSAANIFSSLKLVYIFSVNPHLGPLQVSLSRMVMDIMKFFFLYVLVLFAFSCGSKERPIRQRPLIVLGLNQLLWYYADAERQKCRQESDNHLNPEVDHTEPDSNACTIWRRFSNLFETSQTLFWAVFGLIDLESFELNEIKIFTRFWGMLMFGTYSVINIVVLLNLLIAMMNHSYQLISERADTEWKFARSKLWISYFEEGGTVPQPFNIIPTFKSMWYIIEWVRRKFCGHSRAAKKEHMRTIRRKVKQASERDFRYQGIMRNLVRRYVTVEQRKAENQGTGGKKNRQKERRLMKGFNIGPQPSTSTGSLPPVAEFIASLQHHQEGQHHDFFGSTLSGIFNSTTPRKLHQHSSTVSSSQGSINESHHQHQHHHHHKRLNLKRSHSHKRRWGTLIEAAKTGKVSRLIGRSRSEDSVCNNCRENSHDHHSRSHSNSPASEDNGSMSLSDSNPSLDGNVSQERELHGIAHGLALLKKKRKKFSASRNTSPIVPPVNPTENIPKKTGHKKFPQVLKRASSVPTRVPEVIPIVLRHEKTQSQQDSIEVPTAATSTLTPSTTEESVTTIGPNPINGTSREPLMCNSSSSNPATGSLPTPDDEYKPNTSHSLSKLPGVIPVSGHNGPTGWL